MEQLSTVVKRSAVGPFYGMWPEVSDADIRAALSAELWARTFGGSDALLEEVECWRGYVRADYLGYSDDAISIIEIKSDRDSMERFDEQQRVYSATADRVLLVVGWRLAARALQAAPSWWDVVLAERGQDGELRLVPLRDGSPNPQIQPEALVAMLPMDDVSRLARSATTRPETPKLRGRSLRHFVAMHVPFAAVRKALRDWLQRLSAQRAAEA